MKKTFLFNVILISAVIFLPFSSYAAPMRLSVMLDKLTKPSATSLQVLNLVEQYKGETVRGKGRIKDILKSFGGEGGAMIYIDEVYRGATYELVIETDKASVQKLKKGQQVSFQAVFVGMTFRTLRFEQGRVKSTPWWWPWTV